MKIPKHVLLLGILLVICTMVVATQYARTDIGYQYVIVHPSDAEIRYIGSDNASDGVRMIRVTGDNNTNIAVSLHLGNQSTGTVNYYSAAFGIVNEQDYPLILTHINVTSDNDTYLRIWVHGNRTANAEDPLTDPDSVYMYNNGTLVNTSNTTAWILAPGDKNASTMCSNTSDRTNNTIITPWDDTAHVRYSVNNSIAVSNVSDYMWVQIAVEIPPNFDFLGAHTGTIWIYFESDTNF